MSFDRDKFIAETRRRSVAEMDVDAELVLSYPTDNYLGVIKEAIEVLKPIELPDPFFIAEVKIGYFGHLPDAEWPVMVLRNFFDYWELR